MLTIQKKISPYNHYDYNNPKYIIIHYVGANSTAKNNADYFYGGDRQASAHLFVDDNECWQSVEFNNGAWHIGNSVTDPNNTNSIGIEMCLVNGVVTAKTEQNTLEIVKYLMNLYKIPIGNIRTHAEVTNYGKTCPNWSANNWERWKSFKAKLGGAATPTPAPQPSKPSTPPKGTDEQRRYSEIGTFYPNTTIYFRNAPAVDNAYPTQGQYTKGENVKYDIVVIGNRYNWISWISASTGVRRYMPVKDKVTGESWGKAV